MFAIINWRVLLLLLLLLLLLKVAHWSTNFFLQTPPIPGILKGRQPLEATGRLLERICNLRYSGPDRDMKAGWHCLKPLVSIITKNVLSKLSVHFAKDYMLNLRFANLKSTQGKPTLICQYTAPFSIAQTYCLHIAQTLNHAPSIAGS